MTFVPRWVGVLARSQRDREGAPRLAVVVTVTLCVASSTVRMFAGPVAKSRVRLSSKASPRAGRQPLHRQVHVDPRMRRPVVLQPVVGLDRMTRDPVLPLEVPATADLTSVHGHLVASANARASLIGRERNAMIGIPTPTCAPSPNFNDTCTGLPAGLAGAVDDAAGRGRRAGAVARADCVAVLVVPIPRRSTRTPRRQTRRPPRAVIRPRVTGSDGARSAEISPGPP